MSRITYQVPYHDEVPVVSQPFKNVRVVKRRLESPFTAYDTQAVYAIAACARIGAIHSVIFWCFSAHAIAIRNWITDGVKLVYYPRMKGPSAGLSLSA